jgi:uncharacterized protein (DUF2336 family)
VINSVSTVLADLDKAMASRSGEQRVSTAARVADMFILRADAFNEEQIDVFGAVIGRLAANVPVPGRVQLSEKLADVIQAPTGVIRQLALDEIAVARPVLVRSPRLSDQDLIAVASSKGHSHMLAITERPNLAEPVTDYLVVKGDRVISHGLAVNQTARFSRRGMGLLVTRSLTDDSLQSALGQRIDLPDELQANLAQAVNASARRRLMGKTSAAAITAAGAETTSGGLPLDAAALAIAEIQAAGKLTEDTVAGLARDGALAETICGIAALAQISAKAAELSLTGQDRDAIVVISRAMGWSWATLRALLGLRPEGDRLPHAVERAKTNFENLSAQTAQRVLQFIRVRDQSGR